MALMGHSTIVLSQAGFRIRNDVHSESTDDGWFVGTNEDWVVSSAAVEKFRARFLINAATINVDADVQFTLEYSHNEGSFTPVNTTSSVVRSVTSDVTGYDDDDDTTQLIGAGVYMSGSNSMVNVNSASTGTGTFLSSDGATQEVETEWVLGFVFSDLSRGDSIELRIRNFDTTPLFGGYTHVPIISFQKPRINIKGRELRINRGTLEIK